MNRDEKGTPVTVRQNGRMAVRPFGARATQAEMILPEDPHRRYLLVQNNSGVVLLIGVGGLPVAGQCLQLASGVYWEPLVTPTDSIYILAASGTNARGVALFVSQQ